ncbi:unnamed protein product [Calicophoron daubneyi]|uniref:Uncharacterized protein n=1 Tax=Calicophoron daubneyi TaxID=300641 RepID=A0AAV2TQB1_CALDB
MKGTNGLTYYVHRIEEAFHFILVILFLVHSLLQCHSFNIATSMTEQKSRTVEHTLSISPSRARDESRTGTTAYSVISSTPASLLSVTSVQTPPSILFNAPKTKTEKTRAGSPQDKQYLPAGQEEHTHVSVTPPNILPVHRPYSVASKSSTSQGSRPISTRQIKHHFNVPSKSTDVRGNQGDEVWSKVNRLRMQSKRPTVENESSEWTDSNNNFWTPEKKKEVLDFVMSLSRRVKPAFDRYQAIYVIYEWEKYQHYQRYTQYTRRTLQELQRRREYQRMHEYQRYLRYFASELTHKQVKEVSKAKNFGEFKRILFHHTNPTSDSNYSESEAVTTKRPLPVRPLIGPRVQHPLPDHNVVAVASSALQFPEGNGGGIMTRSLRVSRKLGSLDGRAMFERQNPVKRDTFEEEQPNTNATHDTQANCGSGEEQNKEGVVNASEEIPTYSEAELRSAFESYQVFKKTACQLQNHTLCTLPLLGLQQHHTTLVIPKGFHVQRCGTQISSSCSQLVLPPTYESNYFEDADEVSRDPNYFAILSQLQQANPQRLNSGYDTEQMEYAMERSQQGSCSCELPEEECLPLKVSVRTQAVAVIHISPFQHLKHSTELIVLTDHLSCGCQPRCTNRVCISPLKLVTHTFSDCACVCPPNDRRCHNLLEGKEQFTVNEIPLPLNGSFILPPCRYGSMDDLHLYHRRCPRPVRRLP